MYVLLTLDEDFAFYRIYSPSLKEESETDKINSYKTEIGLEYKGIKRIPYTEIYEDIGGNQNLKFHFIYQIQNKKKFTFACIKANVYPKIVPTNPIECTQY